MYLYVEENERSLGVKLIYNPFVPPILRFEIKNIQKGKHYAKIY